jgi:undecaprenyl-diphosphatase
VALALTSLGSVPAIVVMGVLLSWILLRAGRRIDAWTLGVVLAGAGIMSVTLKIFFGVQRPEVFTPLYIVTNPSFPSGHSLISFSLWGFVAALLVRRWPASLLAWIGACAALLLAALVAMTRLYIGVHWPTDVVAGMLLAAAWLALCFWGRKLVRESYARLSRE